MKKWIKAARLFAVGGSILPAVLGGFLAYYEKSIFNLFYFFLVIIGSAALHTGANFINDYFDYVTGADDKNTEGIYPFSGGSRVIQEGIIPAKHILLASILCFAVGSASGIFLFIVSGFWVIIFTAIGLLSSIFYVSPRLSTTNLGLGELSVGFNLGFLIVNGAYYVQTKAFSFDVFMISLPVAITTTLILLVNEFPDYKGDSLAGKKNIVVRLGPKKSSYLLITLVTVINVLVVINVIFGFFNVWSLLSLLTLPFMIHASIIVSKYHEDRFKYVPAIISILNVNTFVNLYLVAACFALASSLPIFYILAGCIFSYELVTIKRLNMFPFISKENSPTNTHDF